MRRIGLLAAIIAIGTSGSASAATIEVDSATDDGTGCTLREAVASADGNADSGGCTGAGDYGDDEVSFVDGAVSGTIALDSPLHVNPTSPGTLHIDAPEDLGIVLSGMDQHRVVVVSAAADIVGNEVVISGLTIRDGLIDTPDQNGEVTGAGVLNFGRLTLDRVVVRDNLAAAVEASDEGAPAVAIGRGGGIRNDGVLAIANSTIRDNSATATATTAGFAAASAKGGGIDVNDGNLVVRESTISGNMVSGTALGSPTIIDTIGAGIFVRSSTGDPVAALVATSTIVGNTAPSPNSRGGGVAMDPGIGGVIFALRGDTITGNGAAGGANIHQVAGGMTVASTVLAEPLGGGSNCPAGAGGTVSAGHNLSDDASCALAFNKPGDINSTSPNLEALANNGGPTLTRRPAAPTAGTPSPLIDAGIATDQLALDQRGLARTVDYDTANGPGGDGTDIGAVEIQGATPTATTPASPSGEPNPFVTGTAADASAVHLFSDSDCATEVASGTPQDFASPGFAAGPLASGTTTDFRATAEYGAATSLCSPTGVSYTLPELPPDPGTGPGTDPGTGADPGTKPKKKCKKGQKLKKGKCVKKKPKKKKKKKGA